MGNFTKKSRHTTTFEAMVKENSLEKKSMTTSDAGFGKCDKCGDDADRVMIDMTPDLKTSTMRKLCFKCVMNMDNVKKRQ